MAKVISIVNNKGGVGKTTSTGILSEILAFLGKKVLAVDLDQQCNLSMMMKVYVEDSEAVINGIEQPTIFNITELFKYRYRQKEDVEKLILKTKIKNLDIIPASKRHKNTQLNISMNETGNNNIILKRALSAVRDDYDFILIDNAPANDILTVNSMFTSDMVLVPVRMEGFSYEGLKECMKTILYIKEEHDIDNLELGGVYITQAEINTNIFRDIREVYEKELGCKFLDTAIRKDIKASEIETAYKPILEYAPDTNLVFDYCKLILELNILDELTANQLKAAIGIV